MSQPYCQTVIVGYSLYPLNSNPPNIYLFFHTIYCDHRQTSAKFIIHTVQGHISHVTISYTTHTHTLVRSCKIWGHGLQDQEASHICSRETFLSYMQILLAKPCLLTKALMGSGRGRLPPSCRSGGWNPPWPENKLKLQLTLMMNLIVTLMVKTR